MMIERHQTWENFQTAVFEPGGVHPIPGSPPAWVYGDRASGRLGIRIAVPADIEVPACLVVALDLHLASLDVGTCLELSCRVPDLNRQFYALALDVADAVQVLGQSTGEALAAAVSQWEQLLRVRRILSTEQQTGLYGELWLLRRLVEKYGPAAHEAWMGPHREPHDFRWDDVDIEVKTTTQARRIHVINKLGQLETAPGRSLYVLSLVIQPAGGAPGTSLADVVGALRHSFAGTEARGSFDQLLVSVGYHDRDEPFYRDKWCLRAAPALIPVDSECPRLVRAHVEAAIGALAARIDDVHYRVDLDGLGWLDPDQRFTAIIP